MSIDVDKLVHDLRKNIRKQKYILEEIVGTENENKQQINLIEDMNETINSIYKDWIKLKEQLIS